MTTPSETALSADDYRALLQPLLDRMAWTRTAREDPKVSVRVFAANTTAFPWEHYERDIRALLDAFAARSQPATEGLREALDSAVDAVLAYGAAPPEYPGLALVPQPDIERLRRIRTAIRVSEHSPHDQAGEPVEGFPVCSVCGAIQTDVALAATEPAGDER